MFGYEDELQGEIEDLKELLQKSYSEEEVLKLLEDRSFNCCAATKISYVPTQEWFNKIKK